MRLRLFLAVVFAIFITSIPSRAAAQTCTQLTWGETTTRAFVFTYQASNPLGQEIATAFGSTLDEEFNRFSNLFRMTLQVPVMVRIYPTERDYYCFNALAPQIPLGQTHSHIGGREIALIAQNIRDDPESWQVNGLDALRGELAVLFINALSAGKAPPGLQTGVNIYAQDPFVTFEHLINTTAPPYERPSASWRNLWDTPDLIVHPDQAVQATSITAYLVDVYGWERFIQFAGALRTAESWRLALESIYPASANALESQWADVYYARFMSGRWRENALYSLSLAPYEQLIAGGAYQAAADGLADVIKLLIDLEDFDRLSQAEALNATAYRGLEADALARQARQTYLEGDYAAAQSFAADAITAYINLSDMRNLESLLTIEKQAAEVIELNAELDSIETRLGTPAALAVSERLQAIGARLGTLGDSAGAARAAEAIATLNTARKQFAMAIAIGGALLAIVIFLLRLKHFTAPPPPETQLQA